ncbi:MAG: signal peptidase I [Clostridiales bacterium]|nr:signal peptidase I [Clostridiales bacterium]
MKTIDEINQEFVKELLHEMDAPADNHVIGVATLGRPHISDNNPVGEAPSYTPAPCRTTAIVGDDPPPPIIPLSHKPAPVGASCACRRRASDIIFYAVIALILVAALLYSGKTNDAYHLFGYSGFTVLSGSMQREIPQGSLVITKQVVPRDIKVGDDITFVRSDNTTVTHRVVAIIRDFEETGRTVFQTQGLENAEPDEEYVHAGNVIGVVKHTIPNLGFLLAYVSENIGLVLLMLGGVLIATIMIGRLSCG